MTTADEEPQPRTAPGSRAGRDPEDRPRPLPPRSPRLEPVVDIRPPRWFVTVSVVAAGLFALLGLAAAVAGVVSGDPLSAVVSLAGGTGLAVMAYDASTRSVVSSGDELVVRQWFKVTTLRRPELVEFAAARASFFRWDIVVEPFEGRQVRLWVTRTLSAGRPTRQRWLADLEAWRIWVGPTGS